MKKYILLLLLTTVLLSFLSADAIALLIANKGKVSLDRAAAKIKFQKGELLMNNDVLRTGEESFAAYKYVDASATIKMFSNSVATLNAGKDGKTLSKTVTVSKGNVLSNVKKGSGLFRINTPTTVASVKGTEFLTKVEEGGATTFIVSDGEVEVRVLATEEVARVGKGKTAIIGVLGNIHLRDSNPEDLSQVEQAELESMRESTEHIILIPVMNENGDLKYIEITY